MERKYVSLTNLQRYTSLVKNEFSALEEVLNNILSRLEYVEEQLNSQPSSATTTVLRENYSPAGASWTDTVALNFTKGDYIETSIDLSGCTEEYENILSVGDSIATWGQSIGGFHLYYTPSTKELEIDSLVAENNTRTTITLTSTTVVIKISALGVYVDGAYKSSNAQIVSHTSTQIGSVEGETRSNAYYEYIKVVKY